MKRSALLLLAGLLFTGAALRDAGDDWIDRTVLPPVLAETSVEMRDRNGVMLRAFAVEDGIMRLSPPPASAVDPGFVDMLLRYEDKRFRDHAGVDPLALIRATAQAAWQGRVVSGGSTLTMQVARLIENGPTGRWAGKLRQIRVALALERRLDKDRILGLYLTHAPYGGSLEGLRAATLAWFGKEPRRLTPAEAALLVALPQSPEARRPDRHADGARVARARVLDRMLAQGVLDGETRDAARREAVPTAMRPFPRLAPHLADRLRALRPELGRHDVTLDAGVQARMEALITRAVQGGDPRLSGALVLADHRTGQILATVGSPGYDDAARRGFVDMTRALRSPGSTLKPLVYGLAFDQGLVHPETLIRDAAISFGQYAPRNFDGQFRGDVRVRDALQMSLNIPVVKLTHALGPARLMDALDRSGAQTRLPGGAPGLAVSLGGIGIDLQDLVQLYAAIASGGQGRLLSVQALAESATSARLMSRVAAWQVGDILGGLTPPPAAPRGVLAYKTGTSYGHRDAWAVGFDGAHVIGVWMGRADGTPVPGAFGGDLAAPVLFEAFGRLKPAFDPLPPPPPATLLLGAAQLPAPLRRFEARQDLAAPPGDAPILTFPPDGARLSVATGTLTLKLRGGQAPFTVLANGAPVAIRLHRRELDVPSPGRGFSTFVVVDRTGQSDRVTVKLD